MSTRQERVFSLADPLPHGTTVLEASAGTGKTFAIAALAARFLAEGNTRIDDLLLVTFSRAATAELRARVRERIQGSAAALRAALAQGVPPNDAVDQLLFETDPVEAARRASRLEDALNHFDRATIMTTHEFCSGMLRGLGVLATQEPQSSLVEDLLPLADEAAADVYLRRYAFDDRFPPFPWERSSDGSSDCGARELARDAVTLEADLGPADAVGAVAERVFFAGEVRAEVAARKRRLRVYSFDDQLTRLRDALLAPDTGRLACAKLARRFPVVLIDEFQDTDPVQWQIVRAAFGTDATLVLIGDPKQAIYAFRGADVHTYTAAVHAATTRTTLRRNYRADKAVVDAVGALFEGVRLGEEIDVPPIEAHWVTPRLRGRQGTPWASGLQVRVIPSAEPLTPWLATRRITDDLVTAVSSLLGDEPPLTSPDGSRLRASEIAVLVRSNARGKEVASALIRAGVPATFSGTSRVFASQAASDWLTLLTALEAPRRPYVQRAILTDFVGGTLEALATADDVAWAQWSLWLHSWGRVLRRSGVPALVAAIDRDTGFTARMLARTAGERTVTDHRHLAELLHERASAPGASAPGASARELGDWLAEATTEANASSERTRRLETDDSAVQIMTVHRAKGLQFPVVLLPEASRSFERDRDEGRKIVLPIHDGRLLDVGGTAGPDRPDRWRRHREDEADEALRSLYVAMTRAQSHVVAWWANHWDTAGSPLHRLLHAAHEGAAARPALAYDPRLLDDGGSPLTLAWLESAGIAVVEAQPDAPATPRTPAASHGPLQARSWTRTIDQGWRRTSYSGLTAAAHAASVETELVADEGSDEGIDVSTIQTDPLLRIPSPMATLPGGAAFGTLVHAVYETVDARGDDWRPRLRDSVETALRRWPIAGVDASTLADALAPTLETPLGPLGCGTILRDYGPGNRLSELDFEFPLDAPGATLADVAALLARHLPPDDPLADYPARLLGPTLTQQRLHGFLTGSIDAVLRLPDGGHLIVDYKTNRLDSVGLPAEDLTVGHYVRPALAEAMMASHYPLQALLYSVALHRFLQRRVRDYDPDRQLAGTAYLFVRGMAGPDTPVIDTHPTGVFSWRPSTALVQDVSRLLAGGVR